MDKKCAYFKSAFSRQKGFIYKLLFFYEKYEL